MGTSSAQGLSRQRVGELRRVVESAMRDFDADLVTVAEAMEIARDLTAMKNQLAAAEVACTKRAARTSVSSTRSDPTGAKAAARRLGVSNAEAANLLRLGEDLESCPEVKEAFEAGRLSPQQAAEVARTVTTRPEGERGRVERELVGAAQRESLGELRKRCQQVRSEGEDAEARFRRVHAERYLRTWIDGGSGAGRGSWSVPPEWQGEVVATLRPLRERIFAQARRDGRCEDAERYDADALVELARDAAAWAEHTCGHTPAPGDEERCDREGAAGGDGLTEADDAPSGGPDAGALGPFEAAAVEGRPNRPDLRPGPARRGRSGRREKVIVRVDWSAVLRGHVAEGEVCDIVGVGPVSVAAVRDMLRGDPVVAAIATDGVDVRSVTHLGRRATAAMRTALQWADQGCSVLGCANRVRLEIDHSVDWAATLHTRLDELDLLCHRHHQQKTHDGYRLEPGRGKRRFLSPDEQRATPASGDPPSSRSPEPNTCDSGGDTGHPPTGRGHPVRSDAPDDIDQLPLGLDPPGREPDGP